MYILWMYCEYIYVTFDSCIVILFIVPAYISYIYTYDLIFVIYVYDFSFNHFIGFFFNRLRIFFFIGWHSVFEKIIGWLLIGFFKIKKMLGCGMIGFSILIKIIGWEYSVSTFLSKNARLDFNRFFVKKQKLLG